MCSLFPPQKVYSEIYFNIKYNCVTSFYSTVMKAIYCKLVDPLVAICLPKATNLFPTEAAIVL
jgi:hypothetical protein